jgi:hypothetical protein
MHRARLTTTILALVCGALVACGSGQTIATPTPTPAPRAAPPGVSASPATPAATTAATKMPSAQLSTLTPEQGGTLVLPSFQEVLPPEASPGEEVRVIGRGGYLKLTAGGYNEANRNFPLLFDGVPIGQVSCYVNRCEGKFIIPADTTPGPHLITTEGGAITVTVR